MTIDDQLTILPGGFPALRVGGGTDPILVLNGGQAFMRRPTLARFRREAGRVARLLPKGESFVLLGYPVEPPGSGGLSDRLAEAVRRLGSPVRLMAISYGGPVALDFAARYPALVSHLVLIATAHAYSAGGIVRVNRQRECVLNGDFAGLIESFGGVFRRPWFNWLLKLRIRLRAHHLGTDMNEPDVIANYLSAGLTANGSEGTDWLADIRACTLILGGSDDEFFGTGRMEQTARSIAGSVLVVLPGETHMAPVERARTFRSAISSFLADSS
jgi:pimeloyl-ACP methyl ester carboxylesterase